jgi:hypothetical protein
VRFFIRIAAGLLLFNAVLSRPLEADTVNWLYSDGDWFVPSNWSSNATLPGVNDDVVIDRPGLVTVTLSSSASIHSLVCENTLTAASLTLAADSVVNGTLTINSALNADGNLDIGGKFNWNGGTLSGAGKLTLSQTAVGDLYGSAATLAKVVDNAGTWNVITSGNGPPASIYFLDGTFNNLSTGVFNVIDSLPGTTSNLFFGVISNVFNNAGTFNLNSGTNVTRTVGVKFNNTGTLNVNSGKLSLTTFGGNTNTGTINVLPAGGLVAPSLINTGTINLQGLPGGVTGSSFPNLINDVGGHVNVISGTHSLNNGLSKNLGEINVASNGSLAVDSMEQVAGSKITGSGAVTLSNIANFAGALEATGPITITRSTNFNSNQTINGPLTINRTQTETSTLGGTGDIVVTNSLNWITGNLGVGGKLSLASSSVNSFALNGTSQLGRVLENAGTVNFNAGSIALATGGRISNLATGIFNVSTPALGWFSVPFDNAGTLNVAAGTSASPTVGTINNLGTLNVNSGFISLTGTNSGIVNLGHGAALVFGGLLNTGTINVDPQQALTLSSITNALGGKLNVLSSTLTFSGPANSGQIEIAKGATLIMPQSNYPAGSSLTGSGSLSMSNSANLSGALLVSGPISFVGGLTFLTPQDIPGTLTLNTGNTLSGSADINLSNTLNWLQGSMTGTGKTTIGPAGKTTLVAGTLARTLENSGTLTFNGSTNFSLNNGQFKNLVGGVVNVNTSTGGGVSNTGTSTFSNAGTMNVALQFNATTPTFTEAAPLTNSGTLGIDYGILFLSGGGTNSGTINVRPGGTLGLPTTSGQFTNQSTINFSGGVFTGNLTNAATGQLNVTGSLQTSKPTDGLQNAGKITIAAGGYLGAPINTTAGSTINGPGSLGISSTDFSGTLDVTGDVTLNTVTFNADQELKASSVMAGTISGPGNVVVKNDFLWQPFTSTQTLSGTGKLTLQGSSSFGPSPSFASGAWTISKLVENAGTLTWNPANITYRFNNGTLNNLADGTINAAVAATTFVTTSGVSNQINNFGVFNKLGTGLFSFPSGVAFNNSNIVNIQQGKLFIGNGTQSGTFNISNQGKLEFGSTSPVFNAGTAFSGAGELTISASATLPGPNAFSGTTIVKAPLQLAHPSALQNSAVQLTGGALSSQGLVTAKVASLQMSGVAAGLHFELGGTSNTSYDRLIVAGAANLDGNLSVTLVNNFAPASGNVFDILDAASVTGTFPTIALPVLTGPLIWDTTQLYATGTLSVAEGFVPGDLDRDGKISLADLPAMLSALTDLDGYQSNRGLNSTELLTLADFDHSGAVTNADIQGMLDLLASQPAGELNPVPEPAGFVSACVAAIGLAIYGKRRVAFDVGNYGQSRSMRRRA